MKYLLILLFIFTSLNAQTHDEEKKLKKMIGHMLIVGFEDQVISYDSPLVTDLQTYNIAGVILFDTFYHTKKRIKNILSPYQLQHLTARLKQFSKKNIFIAIDQEGGKVARLKPKYGFTATPSAEFIAQKNMQEIHKIYAKQSKMLKHNGINTNFAPVVDLARNKKNKVIVQLERSYGENPQKVTQIAKIMIEEQKKENIISVLKHFPGHGSSLGDSHKGFVDISDTWSKEELIPYKKLINENMADMIMTAHVFNKKLDSKYPATLSHKINTQLLREKMHFKGVIVSDDMQMRAITKEYSLEEATRLAINSGVDLLLFANQLSHNSVKEIVDTIYNDVQNGKIPLSRIKESNTRVSMLLTQNSIIQKPIVFGKKRFELTKKYIQKHYGLTVQNITIVPKNIVVHWTAIMDFEKSFARFNSQLLFSDRKDIAEASALNVSTHYLIDRDGTIYQLMPDNWMARHVIGLNYSSIGIENVGGEKNTSEDLTDAQLKANIRLISYLKLKYPSIKNILGHYEYREYERSPLWLEKDKAYRTKKADPGKRFMKKIRQALDE